MSDRLAYWSQRADTAEAEVERRERILREALNGDDSGDFDALVVCVRAIDEVRAELDAEVERLRSALGFYADPETWNTISRQGTVTTNTLARQDSGERARDALCPGKAC